MKNKLKIGSLFCGMGGIDLAFKQAGAEIAWGIDFDKWACQVASYNGILALPIDIHNVEFPEKGRIYVNRKNNLVTSVDILTAGFPCQSFSIAGKRNKDDPRGKLYLEVMRAVKEMKPKAVFLENVPLFKHSDEYWDMFKLLSELGYILKDTVLDAYDYTISSQMRKRWYGVAFRHGKDFKEFEFPKPHEKLPIKRDCEWKEQEKVDDKYYYPLSLYWDEDSEGWVETIYKNPFLDPTLESDYIYSNNADGDVEIKLKEGVFYQWRRTYMRETKDGRCPTLTANMGTGGHNVPIIVDDWGVRKLTPRECARLQGFPDSFIFPEGVSDSQLYKMIGNSVSVPMVELIAKNIIEGMKND